MHTTSYVSGHPFLAHYSRKSDHNSGSLSKQRSPKTIWTDTIISRHAQCYYLFNGAKHRINFSYFLGLFLFPVCDEGVVFRWNIIVSKYRYFITLNLRTVNTSNTFIKIKLSVWKFNDDFVYFVARISVKMSDTEGCVSLGLLHYRLTLLGQFLPG